MAELTDKIETAHAGADSARIHERMHRDLSVEVFGYTNRKPAPDGKSFLSLDDSGGVDDKIHYYKEIVPVDTKEASLSSRTDGKLTMLSDEQFHSELTQAVKANGGDLGIYIPGVRNLPGEAAYNAAQLSQASGETFLVADWASSKRSDKDSIFDMAREFIADSRASIKSQPMVDTGVEEWVRQLGGEHVDLVAHSRGTTMLSNTLAGIQSMGLSPVRSATFSHGDKPVEKFTDMFPSMYKAASHMNFLVDPKDRALRLAAALRFWTTPVFNSRWDFMPSQAAIGTVGVSQRLKQVSSNYVPHDYFTVRKEVGFGSQRHTPDLASTVAALHTSRDVALAGSYYEKRKTVDLQVRPYSNDAIQQSAFKYLDF